MTAEVQIPSDSDYVTLNSTRFTFKDISNVVEHFYKRVAIDQALRTPFSSVEDWPHHIQRLTHFWWIRFGGRSYLEGMYDPIGKHFESGFNEHLLERWLDLFREVLDQHLSSEQAQLWSSITHGMGSSLLHHNELMLLRHQNLNK